MRPVIFAFVSILALAFSSSAFAQFAPDISFDPPPDQPGAPETTGSGGTR